MDYKVIALPLNSSEEIMIAKSNSFLTAVKEKETARKSGKYEKVYISEKFTELARQAHKELDLGTEKERIYG